MQQETAPAPIALFVYRRPEPTLRALRRLKACDGFTESRLHVFSDGPKNPEQAAQVDEVRRIVATEMPGARLVARPWNIGLAKSVGEGVTQLAEAHGRVIVLEDDLAPAPDFLTWMDRALDRYADDDRVMQISGHMFGVDVGAHPVFLPFISSWGWATWARAWKHFDPTLAGAEALAGDRVMRRRFNIDGSYDYAGMARKQLAGAIDSWGIAWNWTVFRNEGLVLYPPLSRVLNLGLVDPAATHGGTSSTESLFDGRAAFEPMPSVAMPEPALSRAALNTIAQAFRKERRAKIIRRLRPW